MNVPRFEKLPNSVRYTPLFAPIGSGSPTCAITTPISPAGTCTHGNFCTAKIGHSLIRSPGISSSAWYPASPRNAIGLSSGSLRRANRLLTSPTCGGTDQVHRLERRTTTTINHDDEL